MVIESEREKSQEESQPIIIAVSDFVNRQFPEVKRTKTAAILSQLLADIYPLCQTHRDGSTRELVIKGSSIKRFLLGDPDSYWDISRIYRQVDPESLEADAEKLVQRFAIGPRDIDFRYELEAGRQDQDVYRALVNSLEHQGFRGKNAVFFRKTGGKSYKAVISQTELGGINAPPRTFYKVLIYIDDRFLLRADFGREADLKYSENHASQMHDEFRVSLFTPVEEVLSVAEIYIDRNQVWLKVNKDIVEDFDTFWPLKLSHFSDRLPLVLIGRLKGLGFRTFWPELNNEKSYDYNRLLQLFLEAEYVDPTSWLRWYSYDDNLEKRKMEYVSDFLLYLTYDPFLFLRLLYDLHFLPMTGLDKYISDRDDLMNVLLSMAEEIDPEVIPDDLILHTAKYSDLYKKKVLKNSDDVTATGPFMLIRAINKLLAQKGINQSADESFARLIHLFDPNNSDAVKALKKIEEPKLDIGVLV